MTENEGAGMYMGEKVEDMTREQLLDVIRYLGREIDWHRSRKSPRERVQSLKECGNG